MSSISRTYKNATYASPGKGVLYDPGDNRLFDLSLNTYSSSNEYPHASVYPVSFQRSSVTSSSSYNDILYSYMPRMSCKDKTGSHLGTMFQHIVCPGGITTIDTLGGGYQDSTIQKGSNNTTSGYTWYRCNRLQSTEDMKRSLGKSHIAPYSSNKFTIDCNGKPITSIHVYKGNPCTDFSNAKVIYTCGDLDTTNATTRSSSISVAHTPNYYYGYNAYDNNSTADFDTTTKNSWYSFLTRNANTRLECPNKVFTKIELHKPSTTTTIPTNVSGCVISDAKNVADCDDFKTFMDADVTYTCASVSNLKQESGKLLAGDTKPYLVKGLAYVPMYTLTTVLGGYKSPDDYKGTLDNHAYIRRSGYSNSSYDTQKSYTFKSPRNMTSSNDLSILDCNGNAVAHVALNNNNTLTYNCSLTPVSNIEKRYVDAYSSYIDDPKTYMTLLGKTDCGSTKVLTKVEAAAGPNGARLEYSCGTP